MGVGAALYAGGEARHLLLRPGAEQHIELAGGELAQGRLRGMVGEVEQVGDREPHVARALAFVPAGAVAGAQECRQVLAPGRGLGRAGRPRHHLGDQAAGGGQQAPVLGLFEAPGVGARAARGRPGRDRRGGAQPLAQGGRQGFRVLEKSALERQQGALAEPPEVLGAAGLQSRLGPAHGAGGGIGGAAAGLGQGRRGEHAGTEAHGPEVLLRDLPELAQLDLQVAQAAGFHGIGRGCLGAAGRRPGQQEEQGQPAKAARA